MGLDISYASKVDFENRRDPDDESEDILYLYPNDSLLDQSEGIQSGEYTCEGIQDYFRAGSYSGYSGWRRMLASLIGWKIEDLWIRVETLVHRNESINDVLDENDNSKVNIPFVEMLHFSDCEGFIGPKTSAKLHADFLEWDEKAKNFEDSYFYELYEKWTKAFEVASDGGCVIFH